MPFKAADQGAPLIGEGGEAEGVDRVGDVELIVASIIFFPLEWASVEPVEVEGECFMECPAPLKSEEVDRVFLKIVAESVFENAVGGVDGEKAFYFGEGDVEG